MNCTRGKTSSSVENRYRVYVSFMSCYGWHCQFLESDLKTSLPRKLTFATPDKILTMMGRSGGFNNSTERQAFDHGTAIGRGVCISA
jgi:hypothetical protein